MSTVTELFSHIIDPRTGNRTTYPVNEILFGALCAVLCGCKSSEQFAEFTELKLEFLRQYLPYQNGAASHDTFSRLFRLLPPKPFEKLMRQTIDSKHIAIDGKALRGSADPAGGTAASMSLYAFDTENGLALGHITLPDKQSEIPAVSELVQDLKLLGVTVTLDALHCQRDTAQLLHDVGARYALPLKNNQKTMCSDVNLFMSDPATPFTMDVSIDGGHGRVETRIARVSTDIDWLADRKWPGLAALGCVERIRETRTGTVREKQLYLLGSRFAAAELNKLARGHWAIENQLHWVLDVTMGEDACRARRDHAAENIAVLRRIALNAMRLAPSGKSVSKTMFAAIMNERKLAVLVAAALKS